jgi:succinyl-CoA synthetase beta subunit
MIGELRSRALLAGIRGRPAADFDALAGTLVKLSVMAWTLRDRIAEVDINPLVVQSHGQGVVALDALVVLR